MVFFFFFFSGSLVERNVLGFAKQRRGCLRRDSVQCVI